LADPASATSETQVAEINQQSYRMGAGALTAALTPAALGVDESGENFEQVFRKIVPPKSADN
jgi:hypothetical protein